MQDMIADFVKINLLFKSLNTVSLQTFRNAMIRASWLVLNVEDNHVNYSSHCEHM